MQYKRLQIYLLTSPIKLPIDSKSVFTYLLRIDILSYSNMAETNFWDKYAYFYERPIDTLVVREETARHPLTPALMVDFYDGCRKINSLVKNIRPDVIFLPLRGAAPIGWVLDEFEELRGKPVRLKYPIRLGHTTNVETGEEYGTKGYKKRIVRMDLERLLYSFPELTDGRDVSAMLIDEVQSGSTIAEAAEILREQLIDYTLTDHLSVIGAVDSRVQRDKTHDYRQMQNNSTQGIVLKEVRLPLFSIDRTEFLDSLLSPTTHPSGIHRIGAHVMHNIPSKQLLQILARTYLQPEHMLEALNKVFTQRKKCDDNTRFFLQWLRDVFHDNEIYRRRASNKDIFAWLNEFATLCLEKR